jgi:hypothetical protein
MLTVHVAISHDPSVWLFILLRMVVAFLSQVVEYQNHFDFVHMIYAQRRRTVMPKGTSSWKPQRTSSYLTVFSMICSEGDAGFLLNGRGECASFTDEEQELG